MKVDLDDYLLRWEGDLTPVIAAAKPIEIEEEKRDRDYEPAQSLRQADEVTSLFSLKLTDVAPVEPGFRGKNPVYHSGESDDYFVVSDDGETAYDHKHGNVTLNAQTYLLCEMGERRVRNVEGPLSRREKFLVFKKAKEEGFIPDDDRITKDAMVYVALEEGFCTENDLAGDGILPARAYNKVLDHLDFKHGRHPVNEKDIPVIPTFDPEHPIVYQQSTGMSLNDVRKTTQAEIKAAIESSDDVLLYALPSMGKTDSSIYAVEEANGKIAILVPRGHESDFDQGLYRDIEDTCVAVGVESRILPSFHRECESAVGAHGDDVKDDVISAYNNGASASEIHSQWDLPCQENGGCPYIEKMSEDFDEDVLIGHYKHAHVESVIKNRTVIIDEYPAQAFEVSLKGDTLNSAINTFIDSDDDEVDFMTLVENSDENLIDLIAPEYVTPEGDFKTRNNDFAFTENGNVWAPAIIMTILYGQSVGSWRRLVINDKVCIFTRSNQDDTPEFRMLNRPDFFNANNIIALDGTPEQELWEFALDKTLEQRTVVSHIHEEFVTDILRNEIVLTKNTTYPAGAGGNRVKAIRDIKLFEYIDDKHDELTPLIAPRRALEKYRFVNGTSITSEREVGWYGNLLGSNKFKNAEIGIVSGSRHNGDSYIEQWCAYNDVEIEREGTGMDLTYNDEFADALLRQMREHQTVQAIFRFGRDNRPSRIYVNTNALPEWFPIYDEVLWTDETGLNILEVLDKANELQASEIANEIDMSASNTRKRLNELHDEGLISKRTHRGRNHWGKQVNE
ncbi:hypothetical protein C497_05692 [Halalkalicoccus jeotgali B3]|uniref:Uncharacterized protein n=2 Tax=Halalkalicoccus jeotgali TaxID=413810 RepID=D8JAW9_HALJB|nr:hypothetical protein HacjB3_07280 [Halalkalicoccus jeotgali B3]ELY39424.1 hypothetical protein C497_05692 [Halalkalicoccus jeotgali B3]